MMGVKPSAGSRTAPRCSGRWDLAMPGMNGVRWRRANSAKVDTRRCRSLLCTGSALDLHVVKEAEKMGIPGAVSNRTFRKFTEGNRGAVEAREILLLAE